MVAGMESMNTWKLGYFSGVGKLAGEGGNGNFRVAHPNIRFLNTGTLTLDPSTWDFLN